MYDELTYTVTEKCDSTLSKYYHLLSSVMCIFNNITN